MIIPSTEGKILKETPCKHHGRQQHETEISQKSNNALLKW